MPVPAPGVAPGAAPLPGLLGAGLLGGNPLLQTVLGSNPAAQLALQLAARMPPAAVAAVLGATQGAPGQPQNPAAQLLVQLATQQAVAPQPQQPAANKPLFSLAAYIGDTSGPVTLAQAVAIQKAIQCLRDPALSNSLAALVAMTPDQLQNMLSTSHLNIKDVSTEVTHQSYAESAPA